MNQANGIEPDHELEWIEREASKLTQSSDTMYIALVVIYLAAVTWYIISTLINRKKGSESSSSSSGNSQHKHRSRRGKRCPGCKQIIDNRRTLCQHCGHEFVIDPNSEPHPDEIRTGRRKPVQPSDAKTA